MPLFGLNEVILCAFAHVHWGSVFPLDLTLFLILVFSKPSDASETWKWISTGAHSVDPAAESIDADVSPEPAEQQQ